MIPRPIGTSVPRALALPRMPSFGPCANLGRHIKKALWHPKADDGDRHGFRNRIKAYRQAGKTIVYIDESGFAHDMPRTHGYGLRGKRCFGKRDWNAKGRATVIGALVGSALPTVTLFSCNSDSDVFHAWTTCDPIPKLPDNAIIVMDNAAFHKRADTKAAIEKAGHRLEYLRCKTSDLI